MNKAELEKIKLEKLNERKENSEKTNNPNFSKNDFLLGLLNAVNTGKPNNVTEAVKIVDNKVAKDLGEVSVHKTNNQMIESKSADSDFDREEVYWSQIEKKKQSIINETLKNKPIQPTYNTNKSVINESLLTENLKNQIHTYLIENVNNHIQEGIIKTVLELYASDKIKEVIKENADISENIVYQTIRKIQAKNKQNK